MPACRRLPLRRPPWARTGRAVCCPSTRSTRASPPEGGDLPGNPVTGHRTGGRGGARGEEFVRCAAGHGLDLPAEVGLVAETAHRGGAGRPPALGEKSERPPQSQDAGRLLRCQADLFPEAAVQLAPAPAALLDQRVDGHHAARTPQRAPGPHQPGRTRRPVGSPAGQDRVQQGETLGPPRRGGECRGQIVDPWAEHRVRWQEGIDQFVHRDAEQGVCGPGFEQYLHPGQLAVVQTDTRPGRQSGEQRVNVPGLSVPVALGLPVASRM